MLLIIMASSCSYEYDADETVYDGRVVTLDISVTAPPSKSARSLTDADENSVESVLVLLFHPEDAESNAPSTLYTSVETSELEKSGDADNIYTFRARFKVEDDCSDRLIAVCVANASECIPGIASLIEKHYGENYADLKRYFEASASPFVNRMSMWGVALPAVNTQEDNSSVSALLVRDRSRIDIDASSLPLTKFMLEEVRPCKINQRISLLPDADIMGISPFDGSSAVTHLSLPTSDSISDTPWDNTSDSQWHYSNVVIDNKVMREIYLPECDVLMGGNGDPSDSNRLTRPALVVGGRYNGSEKVTYYRVDFMKGGKLVDILRNHLYNVKITEVTGPGEDTPQEAYEKSGASIVAEVLDWTNTDLEIVYDGAHWFSVATKHIELGGSEGSNYALQVASDVDPSQWTMRWEEETGTPLTDYVSVAQLNCDMFGAVRPATTVSEGGFIDFSALFAMTDKDSPRRRIFRLRVGSRLEIPIVVDQYPKFGDPWYQGENIPGYFD